MTLTRRTFLGLVLLIIGCSGAIPCMALEQEPGFLFWKSPASRLLTQKVVSRIAQDGTGAMWFANDEGLNRYDGHRVDEFLSGTPVKGQLRAGPVKGLLTDGQGTLWVSTTALQYFDVTSGGFVVAAGTPDFLPVTAMTLDPDNQLWLGLREAIGVYDTKEGQWRELPISSSEVGALGPLVDLRVTASGRIFGLMAGVGLVEITLDDRDVAILSRLGSDALGKTELRRMTLIDQTLWIATMGDGIYTLDLATGAQRHITRGGEEGLLSDMVYDIQFDGEQLWVCSAGGLLLSNKSDLSFSLTASSSSDPAISGKVYSFFQSNDKSRWAGTVHGLLQGRKLLTTTIDSTTHSIVGNDINAILTSNSGSLWLGSDSGLTLFNLDQRISETINGSSHPELKDDAVMSLTESATALWIGTFSGGLYRYDPATDAITPIPVSADDPAALHASGITALLTHSSGHIIAATFGGGVSILDDEGRVLRTLDMPVAGGTGYSPLALLEDHDGSVLIGTESGVARLNQTLTDIRHLPFANASGHADAIGSSVKHINFPVWELRHGPDNAVWLGTYGHGLLLWHRNSAGETLDVEDLSETLNLPSRSVLGIHYGSGEDLWLSHNAGLSRVDTGSLTAQHYSAEYSFSSIDFNMGASHRAADGTLYFGSDAGVRVIPAGHQSSPRPTTRLGISDIRIMGERLPLRPGGQLPHLKLGYSDIFTAIEVFSDDFTDPSKNAYAYRLAGLDDDWIHLGNGRKLILNRLPAGRYELEFAVRDSSGAWNWQALSIPLTVSPPWWRSYVALGLYSLVLTLLVRFGFWVRRNRQLADRYRLLQQALHPDREAREPPTPEERAREEP